VVLLLLKTGSHRNALDCCQKVLTLDWSHCLIQFNIIQDKIVPHFQLILYASWVQNLLHTMNSTSLDLKIYLSRLQNDLDNKWRNTNWRKKSCQIQYVVWGLHLAWALVLAVYVKKQQGN